MLQELKREFFDEYVDFAYSLALQPSKTSYPVYYDGIKTKKDFVERAARAFSDPDEEILLFLENERVLGWIHYYFLRDDNYLSTASLSVMTHAEKALEEFVAYVSAKYPECAIWLGFPEENRPAVAWLRENGFKLGEECFNDVICLDSYRSKANSPGIIKVTKENYRLFAQIHSQHDEDMYWNCGRMLRSLDAWRILLYTENGDAKGAIYGTKDENAEIFGVDFADGAYYPDMFRRLLEAMLSECRSGKSRHVVFFNDQVSQPDVIAAGFQCIGKYILMTRKSG